tara:strand:+ start:125 stop:367 length:243 start_codon:yes stop_codon:yes gene_type:complete
MFQKEEKKAIIKIILFLFFLDLSYLGKNKAALIEALWLIISLLLCFVLIGIIPLILLLAKRQTRLFKYIKEYETAPCVGE